MRWGSNDQQLNWVKSYLQYVPKGAHLFVCMHAPAYFYNENYKLGRVAELLDLFEGYKVDILSGHTHVQCNTQIRNNIREYNIASIGARGGYGTASIAKTVPLLATKYSNPARTELQIISSH